MTDLIRRGDVAEILTDPAYPYEPQIEQAILQLPAVDAVEVKHGRWLKCEDGWGDINYQCFECGQEWNLDAGTPEENNMNHCPNCGAKMDGGEDNGR